MAKFWFWLLLFVVVIGALAFMANAVTNGVK